jgi:hypothetical protein
MEVWLELISLRLKLIGLQSELIRVRVEQVAAQS